MRRFGLSAREGRRGRRRGARQVQRPTSGRGRKPCNADRQVSPALLGQTVDISAGFTFSVQGCRVHETGSDDCGAWSIYTYNPPTQASPPPPQAALPIKCSEGSPVKSVPAGQQCPAAPAPAAPVKCAAGSVTDTVPAGQQCAAPTHAVGRRVAPSGLNAIAAVTNDSSLPAKCSYTATKTRGIGPQEVDRSIDVGANSTNSITDMLWPPRHQLQRGGEVHSHLQRHADLHRGQPKSGGLTADSYLDNSTDPPRRRGERGGSVLRGTPETMCGLA